MQVAMWNPTPSIEPLAERGRRSAPAATRSRSVIEASVSQVFGVSRADIDRASRGRAPIAEARQVAMYLAHVTLGITMREVGGLFSRDRTTVAHACSVIEDRRDEPDFDRTLELLEWSVIAQLSHQPYSQTASI